MKNSLGAVLSGLFLLLSSCIAFAAPFRPDQGGTGTSTIFTTNRIPFVGASGVYTQDADLTFQPTDTIFTLGGTSVTPLFSMDPTKTDSTLLPYYSAPFLFRSTLTDSHKILLLPYMDITAAANTVAATKGGINVNLERDTGIPAGAKGDFYAYTLNIITNQTNADKWTDGAIGYALNMTNHGGIRMNGIDGSMAFDTLAPENEFLIRMSMNKKIDGENAAGGSTLACNVTAPATTNCSGAGYHANGAWKYGLVFEPITQVVGATPWTAYIRFNNTTADTVATGIEFADNKVGIGIEMQGNTIRFTERAAAPTNQVGNKVDLYAQDNGAGKTQLCALFATGAVQCFATQP